MNEDPGISKLSAAKSKEATNWKLCVLCQEVNASKGTLVQNPRTESYQKLLDVLSERAGLQDGEYVSIYKRLQECTKDTMLEIKAIWHRTCYSDATNKISIQRARDRFEHSMSTGTYTVKKRGHKRTSSEMDTSTPDTSVPFTRSATEPLKKDSCFFCQVDDGQRLFTVRTENSGKSLRKAIEISQNEVLMTRLNNAISPSDAHAIDVRYHKLCWTQNVFRVLRDDIRNQTRPVKSNLPMQMPCLIELINLIDSQTQNKAYLSMDAIETTYISMLGGRDEAQKHTPTLTRQWLKDKIISELPHVKSVRQKDRRKPSVLYNPEACEEDMVHDFMIQDEASEMDDTRTMYKAAKLIRKSIDVFTKDKQQTNTIKVSSMREDVPTELYSLIRWILVGPEEELQTELRSRTVDRSALTISQNIMYAFKTRRQVHHQPKEKTETFRTQHVRENPQVLGMALSVHHDTRNKKLVDFLHMQNCCVSYGRSLLLETAIANAVVENTRQFDGLYVPPFLKKGAFVFFAVDNTDFAEDTADGKGTTHGTITAVYQKADVAGEYIAPSLELNEPKNLAIVPYHVPIMPCNKPKPGPFVRKDKFIVNTIGVDESYKLTTLGWIIALVLSRTKEGREQSKIPGWAGFKSLMSSCQPVTQVGALPLLPEVAHEWPTILTVMLQASKLNTLVVGEAHPTVITFDMALYEKAIQLLDANVDLKRSIVPRLGELHVVMAALRALGSSIENSGIDDAWIEGDVYGSATVRQILKCNHYKRTLRAHIYTYMALYELALDQFFREKPALKALCLAATDSVQEACGRSVWDKDCSPESVHIANNQFLQTLNDEEVTQQLKLWEAEKSSNAMFKSMMNYLHRVETILFFIEGSRNADLILHLQAGEALSKLFFAMDRLKYKRLWPRYIADMHELKNSHPETWKELQNGNISVTKSSIPFVSIGADHACEHLNRMMKVHSGLIGISNNANARQRFFLATPEMSRLSTEFKEQFGLSDDKPKHHHDVQPSAVNKEHEAVNKIKAAILSHGNPFAAEGDQLYNFITHAYIPQESVQQILEIDLTGQKLYEDYITERINGNVSLWAPLKKQNNTMYLSGSKKQAVKIRDQTVDLKETKDLYGRLMVLARSHRDVDQKNAIGNHEFTLTPRALFAPDGSILPCTDKAKLIHSLEHLVTANVTPKDTPEPTGDTSKKIAIVDGMVLVQKMTKKSGTISTVKELGHHFIGSLMNLTTGFDEVILVFDTYKSDSLKQRTREKRRQGKDPIQYQIADDTNIKHIPMTRFLSHEKTKADLTEYLADATLKHYTDSSKLFIVSASGHTRSNHNMTFPENNHEEADTLMICLAATAAQRCPLAELVFFSPDTDVLVLVVANYDKLCHKTSMSMVSGVIEIEPIWRALGREKATALPIFHAFTGADNVGRFSGIGKKKWFQQYMKAEIDSTIRALKKLPEDEDLTQEVKDTLASFVCLAYCPKGVHITNIPELRWHLFCKHLAESNKLPPTTGALDQHIERVRVQSQVWSQSTIMWQQLFNPLLHGYYESDSGRILPITSKILPAPQSIIELVRCQCKTNCSSQRCSCRRHNLSCTDLCLCGTDCENDVDSNAMTVTDDSHSDDDM